MAPLDEEWKSLDIIDIMQEQSLLKTAIEQAIQDGDVDKKELELIMRYLRRACVPEETQNIIRTALEDGDMDEDDDQDDDGEDDGEDDEEQDWAHAELAAVSMGGASVVARSDAKRIR